MSIEPLTDEIQARYTQVKGTRYDVIEANTAKTQALAAEQPKQIQPLFQALGIGSALDITT